MKQLYFLKAFILIGFGFWEYGATGSLDLLIIPILAILLLLVLTFASLRLLLWRLSIMGFSAFTFYMLLNPLNQSITENIATSMFREIVMVLLCVFSFTTLLTSFTKSFKKYYY